MNSNDFIERAKKYLPTATLEQSGIFYKKLLEKNFASDDPFADLIMNVEDPQEELDLKEQQILSQPMKNINDVGKGDNTLPENIDYSASMERLFPE